MLKAIKHIGLLILLMLAGRMAAQTPVIDSVCQGAVRHYRVDGMPGSTYSWLLTQPGGETELLPSDADTLGITWNYAPGTYEFEVVQHSEHGCHADPVFGYIIIYEAPFVFAGYDDVICSYNFYHLSDATAQNTSSILWTTNGDGAFDNDTILHPAYTPGAADIASGFVILTLTGYGQGDDGACEPSVSSLTLTISTVVANVAELHDVTCFGMNDGWVQIAATGGTEPYTFTLNGISNETGYFGNLFAGDYDFAASDANGCETTGTFSIGEPDQMAAEFAFTPATCYGNSDGSITIFNASGGSGNYEYSIDGITWQDNGFFTGLAPAIYMALLRDANAVNCVVVIADEIDIAGPDVLQANVDYSSVSCYGLTDGSITISDPTGGSGDYEYSITGTGWTGTGSYTGLEPGIYEVMIRDAQNPDCEILLATIEITEPGEPLADAGEDAEICSSLMSYTLNGYAENFGSILWETTGNGTFDNPALLNATYTPGDEDIDNGIVQLILTAITGGDCEDATDTMTLVIRREVFAFAGEDVSICENDPYTITDAWALHYEHLWWWHDGAGILTDDATISPSYIPAAGETGLVTLVLTAEPYGIGICPAVTDTMYISITGAPTVYAGPDDAICSGDNYEVSGSSNMTFVSWSTSGDGYFENTTALITTYYPGIFDMAMGQVTLTLTAIGNGNCPDISDSMNLMIWLQATSDAGSDAVICEGDSCTVNNAFASNYSGLLWTHDGAGTISGANTLTPTYTPAAGENGTVTMVLTAYPETALCPAVTDTMTITIIGAPMANAGPDDEVCEGDSYTLAGIANVPTVEWTTTGTGVFDDPNLLTATYFPGQEDIDAGSVTLTLFAFGNTGCGDASDEMLLTIRKHAVAFAGDDAYICENQSYQVNDATAENYSVVLWTHDGFGVLTDENTLTPTYQPAIGETGAITLTLTATPLGGGVCPDVNDSMIIQILPAPVAIAGNDAEICSSGVHELAGSAINFVSVLWTSSGDGTFSDPGTLITDYTPGPNDIDAGVVILTLTANGAGSCGNSSDDLTLTIMKEAIANAGPDLEVCEGHSITITDPVALNFDSLYWSHNGTGILADSTTLTPTYTPGTDDASVITLVLHVAPFGGGICPVVTDTMNITIVTMPQVYAGADAEICEGDNYLLSGIAQNYSSIEWISSGDGTFDNANSLLASYFPGENDIATGQVTLTLTAYGMGTCDDVSDELTLVIVPQAVVFAGDDASICVSDTYHLAGATAIHAASFEWTTSGTGTFSDPATLNPVYTPGIEDIQAGSVVLTLTAYSQGATGTCPPAVSQMTLIISSPQITNLQTSPSLDNQPVGWVMISVTGGMPPYEYSLDGINWQPGSIITGLLAGSYTAWVRDANGCTDTKEFDIYNLVLGEVEIMAGAIHSCVNTSLDAAVMATGFMNIAMFNLKLDFDPTILHLETLIDINPALLNGLLSFTQPVPGSVVITFSSNVPTTIPSDENLFRVEFTGINPGQSTLTWDRPECYFFASSGYVVPSIYITGLVVVHPEPLIAAAGNGEYCEGEALTLTVNSLDPQNLNFEWTGPDGSRNYGPVWNIPSLDIRHSGNFTVTAINDAGCHSELQIPVKVNMLPEVYLAASDTSCIDDQPLLLEPGIWYTSYRWQDGSSSSSYLVTQEGNYWVEVTDENGCTNIASLTIIPCDIELLIPNAFTPNGDGLNDEFGPVVPLVELPNYSMLIYNRWGQLLYETRDIRKGWDGTFNGQPVSMDVYSYVIIYELPSYYNNRAPRRVMGSVMLMR